MPDSNSESAAQLYAEALALIASAHSAISGILDDTSATSAPDRILSANSWRMLDEARAKLVPSSFTLGAAGADTPAPLNALACQLPESSSREVRHLLGPLIRKLGIEVGQTNAIVIQLGDAKNDLETAETNCASAARLLLKGGSVAQDPSKTSSTLPAKSPAPAWMPEFVRKLLRRGKPPE